MWYRRALFRAMPVAAVALPLWLLISRGIIFPDSGWDFLGYLILAPLLALMLGAVAALIWARRSVRSARRVTTADAAILTGWYLLLAAYGFAGDETVATVVAVLAVLASGAVLWWAGTRLVGETRRRIRGIVDGFEQQARPRPGFGAGTGPVIRIEPPAGDDPGRARE